MGTNYYWFPEPFCLNPVHIGKSSAGWCFALRVYPDGAPIRGDEVVVRDLPDWIELWNRPDTAILDEYGDHVTPAEMFGRITNRGSGANLTDAWLATNHAIRGPSGLARHRLDEYCVSHGDGTWDCMVGDFS